MASFEQEKRGHERESEKLLPVFHCAIVDFESVTMVLKNVRKKRSVVGLIVPKVVPQGNFRGKSTLFVAGSQNLYRIRGRFLPARQN